MTNWRSNSSFKASLTKRLKRNGISSKSKREISCALLASRYFFDSNVLINNERQKLELEKKKLAEDQDLVERARQSIQKQKDIVFIEKEKFTKEKRALLVGDLKLLDFQGKEIALQVEIMREELRLAKAVCSGR